MVLLLLSIFATEINSCLFTKKIVPFISNNLQRVMGFLIFTLYFTNCITFASYSLWPYSIRRSRNRVCIKNLLERLCQSHNCLVQNLEMVAFPIKHPTTIAETTTIEGKLSEKTTVLEEIELGLFTGFEDATALEDKIF